MWNDLLVIFLAAFFVAATASLVGIHLILRRQAMFGDVLSHSVLPGIVTAYVLFGKISGLTLFFGALSAGLFSSFLIESLKTFSKRVREDAAMGIVFTSMFALGLLMINVFAGKAHLDVNCVLFGELLFVPLEEGVHLLGLDLPWSLFHLLLGWVLLISIEFLFHKELILSAFHPGMAKSLGVSVRSFHYLLMLMASLAIVVSFEIAGAIMVIGFLIIPASIGNMLSNSFWGIYYYSLVFSVFSIVTGIFISFQFNLNAAASIVSVLFALFLAIFAFKSLRSNSEIREPGVQGYA